VKIKNTDNHFLNVKWDNNNNNNDNNKDDDDDEENMKLQHLISLSRQRLSPKKHK